MCIIYYLLLRPCCPSLYCSTCQSDDKLSALNQALASLTGSMDQAVCEVYSCHLCACVESSRHHRHHHHLYLSIYLFICLSLYLYLYLCCFKYSWKPLLNLPSISIVLSNCCLAQGCCPIERKKSRG